LVGTTRNEVLCGLGGDDRIEGNGGDDVLVGGFGNDTLEGGANNDRLFGGNGDDILSSRGGDDALYGGTGDDVLNGGSGTNRLLGEAGADELNGGIGTDTLDGGEGRDLIAGGAGVDNEIGTRGPELQDVCSDVETAQNCASNAVVEPAKRVSLSDASTGVVVDAQVRAGYDEPQIAIQPIGSADIPTDQVVGSPVEIELIGRSLDVATIFFPVPADVPLDDVTVNVQDRLGRWIEVGEDVAQISAPRGLRVTTNHFSKWGTFRKSPAGPFQTTTLDAFRLKAEEQLCLSPLFSDAVAVGVIVDSSGSTATSQFESMKNGITDSLAKFMPAENIFLSQLDDPEVSSIEDEVSFGAFGGSLVQPAIERMATELASPEYRLRVLVLVSDEDVDDSSRALTALGASLARRNISVLAVEPPSFSSSFKFPVPISDMVFSAGGEQIYNEPLGPLLTEKIFDDAKDTDGDLLSDCEEQGHLYAYDTLGGAVVPKRDRLGDPLSGEYGRTLYYASNKVSVFETDPLRADTDGDGIDDGLELLPATDDLRALTLYEKYLRPVRFFASNPGVKDTDGDGFRDIDEFLHDKDPRVADKRLEFDAFVSAKELQLLQHRHPKLLTENLDKQIEKLQGKLDPSDPRQKKLADELATASQSAKLSYLMLLSMNVLDGAHKNFDKAAGIWDEVASGLQWLNGQPVTNIPETTFLRDWWGDETNAQTRIESFRKNIGWIGDSLVPGSVDVQNAIGWTNVAVQIGQGLIFAIGTAGLGGWALSFVKGGSFVTALAKTRSFLLVTRLTTTLSISCLGGTLSGKFECPSEVVSVLDKLDLVLSVIQAGRGFAVARKAAAAKKYASLTVDAVGEARTARLDIGAADAHFAENAERVDLDLPPVDDAGSAVRTVSKDGASVDVPSVSATGQADDILTSLGEGTTGAAAEAIVENVPASTARGRLRNLCSGSFEGSSEVLMSSGKFKQISDIHVGDVVKTMDPFGDTSKGRVLAISNERAHDRIDITIRSGNDPPAVLRTTTNHLFATPEGWVTAGSLVTGSRLVSSEPKTQTLVLSTQSAETIGSVFDLSISPDQNFFIKTGTNSGSLVHNKKYCQLARDLERNALAAAKLKGNITAASLKVKAHRWGAAVEELMDQVYTAAAGTKFPAKLTAIGKGFERIQGPGGITLRGPDGIYWDKITKTIRVVDAKAKGFMSTSPFSLRRAYREGQLAKCGVSAAGVATGGGWCAEIWDAIQAMKAHPDFADMETAYKAGLAAKSLSGSPASSGLVFDGFLWKNGAGEVR
jgi:hypothetical protein